MDGLDMFGEINSLIFIEMCNKMLSVNNVIWIHEGSQTSNFRVKSLMNDFE